MQSEIEFSRQGYTDLLMQIKAADYTFVRMGEALPNAGKRVVLRHDIDHSVDYALEMARLENDFDVHATYFFMMTSEFYNIFDEKNRKALWQIHNMGHEIGLHWDSRFLPRNSEHTDKFFTNQLRLLSDIIGEDITSASQHVPTDTPAIDLNHLVKVEAYSGEMMCNYAYVSDSSMEWREHTPLDIIKAESSFQFLAHPIWWMSEGSNHEEKYKSFLTSEINDLRVKTNADLRYMQSALEERHAFDERFANRFNMS